MAGHSVSRLLAWLAIAVTLSLFTVVHSEEDVHKPRSRKPEYQCKHPDYHIHMLSRSPLVIYIENFITTKERDHLLRVTFVNPNPSPRTRGVPRLPLSISSSSSSESLANIPSCSPTETAPSHGPW